MQAAFGHTVETHHQPIGPTVGHPVVGDAAREGVDVARIIVVAVDETQFGQRSHPLRPGRDSVDHARGGRARVLRVQRQDQDARHTLCLQGIEFRGDRRVAVAHRIAHRHAVPALAQVAGQQLGLLVGPHPQRRAAGHPDAGVLLGRLGRPHAQDDAMQDRHPQRPRNLDDARVAEELGEVTAQRGCGRLVRCAEVAQQDGGARRGGRPVDEGRFRREGHAVRRLSRRRAAPSGLSAPLGGRSEATWGPTCQTAPKSRAP